MSTKGTIAYQEDVYHLYHETIEDNYQLEIENTGFRYVFPKDIMESIIAQLKNHKLLAELDFLNRELSYKLRDLKTQIDSIDKMKERWWRLKN